MPLAVCPVAFFFYIDGKHHAFSAAGCKFALKVVPLPH
jgi:hypothetical protein